jgi:5'-methylthioadenosine phosphorylase
MDHEAPRVILSAAKDLAWLARKRRFFAALQNDKHPRPAPYAIALPNGPRQQRNTLDESSSRFGFGARHFLFCFSIPARTLVCMSDLRIGLIGGSGLGEAMGIGSPSAGGVRTQRHELDTPFGRPSDAITETEWAGVPVLLLSRHGPGHLIPPTHVNVRANIFALKQLGCTHILASGAVGSLREEYKPRDLVIPDQIIDKTTRRPGTFYESAAVHVEFAEPFCPVLRQILREAGALDKGSGFGVEGSGKQEGALAGAGSSPPSSPEPRTSNPEPPPDSAKIHHGGCYVCMEGPAFSTRAESLMHRLWGGDLIGMTAMPEAKLACEAEIPYALIALVTDYDSWRAKSAEPAAQEKLDPHVLLKEILANLHAASDHALKLIRRAIERMPERSGQLQECPANRALELAIWSDRSRIEPAEIERLRPLWGRYFPAR